jgi:hypothetical protein
MPRQANAFVETKVGVRSLEVRVVGSTLNRFSIIFT